MDLAGRKILVIGGAGFIGSHVIAELLKTSVFLSVFHMFWSLSQLTPFTFGIFSEGCD